MTEKDPAILKLGTFTRGNLDITLNALVRNGYAKVRAKPKLLARSGTAAYFHSGSEMTIMSEPGLTGSSIRFKPFGVILCITPTADTEGNVYADVSASVSTLDPTNSTKMTNGAVSPTFKVREVRASIYVKKGGTMLVAGMILEQEAWITKGVPYLSDIPFFGEILKTHHTENYETELVIFITPFIVAPAR